MRFRLATIIRLADPDAPPKEEIKVVKVFTMEKHPGF